MQLQDISVVKSDFRILVVDDEPDIAEMIQTMLNSDGYKCNVAATASEALSIIKTESVDLLITDICMPQLDGPTLASQTLGIHPTSLVIYITGKCTDQTLMRALEVSGFGFLSKPFTCADLLSQVSKANAWHNLTLEQAEYNEYLKQAIEEKTKELEFKQERLLAEKELLNGIIANASFGLIAVDPMANVHLMNEYAGKILGVNAAMRLAYHGEPLSNLLSSDLRVNLIDLFRKVLEEKRLHEIALIPTRDEKQLNIIAYPTHYRGIPNAVIFVIHDITEKENLHRTLVQTSKLASIGELAAGVAHEINNPIGFVTSNCNRLAQYTDNVKQYIESLERALTTCKSCTDTAHHTAMITDLRTKYDIDYIAEDMPELLKETNDGLSRVSRIVRDLKTFARAEGDTPTVSNINSLLDDALNLVRNQIKYKVEVFKKYGDLPPFVCFANQLVQVFTNLFVNAAGAIKERGNLFIETLQIENRVQIVIRDDGEGIPEKILSKIFDPFFTTKPPGKGTGMGLSISYGIIESHGGKITVKSRVGEGAEFTIVLPIRTEQPAADTKTKA